MWLLCLSDKGFKSHMTYRFLNALKMLKVRVRSLLLRLFISYDIFYLNANFGKRRRILLVDAFQACLFSIFLKAKTALVFIDIYHQSKLTFSHLVQTSGLNCFSCFHGHLPSKNTWIVKNSQLIGYLIRSHNSSTEGGWMLEDLREDHMVLRVNRGRLVVANIV